MSQFRDTELAAAPVPQRFPARLRVARRCDFQRAFMHGRRASDGVLRVWVAANGLDHPRLGISVGKKHGNAVRRNRLKRVAREAFRLSLEEFPRGVDIICMPRWDVELTCTDCVRSMKRLVSKAAERALGCNFAGSA